MKWSIRLSGDSLDLAELAHSLTAPYKIAKRDDDFYYLHIEGIDHIEDSNIALKKVLDKTEVLNMRVQLLH